MSEGIGNLVVEDRTQDDDLRSDSRFTKDQALIDRDDAQSGQTLPEEGVCRFDGSMTVGLGLDDGQNTAGFRQALGDLRQVMDE